MPGSHRLILRFATTMASSDSLTFPQRAMRCLPIPIRTMSLRSRRAEHPSVTLGLRQLDRYHDRAERALTKTITAYGELDGSIDSAVWKSLKSRHGVRLFRGRHATSEGQTPLLCVGTLRGCFDDVLEGLYCDNTKEMLLMNAIKCPRLAESAVLYAVQKKSTLEPYAFTGIKWATIKLSVASNRDLCYFDKMGMVRHTSGKRMAYHVMQSVDLPECPHKSMHKRVRLSLCYVLEELEDNLVGVYMQGEMNYTTMSSFATSAMSDVLLAPTNALECTRAKKLSLLMASNRSSGWKCSSSRKNCYVCKGSSSFFGSTTRCAGCSKHACKKCRFKEHVLGRDADSRDHLKRADFCSVCASKTNLSLDQIRVEASGYSVVELSQARGDPTFCTIDEEAEDVKVDLQGSDRSLKSFIRKITTQVHELSSRGDHRASSLSSIGNAYEEDADEGEDVLNSSRLKAGQFVVLEKDLSRPSRSSTTSTTSSYGHDDEDPESFHISLFAKLQQVSQQAEETLVFAREQSLVAHSVRARSQRNTASYENSGR